MASPKRSLSISQEYEIIQPQQEPAYLMPKSDWDHIKRRIKDLDSGFHYLENFGSLFLGIGATATIAAITFPTPAKFTPYSTYFILWVVGPVLLLFGIICWIFALKQIKSNKKDRNDIISEMESHEPQLPTQ